jgi:hypothetical protein
VSQNGQDNKCPRSSQSKILIHFTVAHMSIQMSWGSVFRRTTLFCNSEELNIMFPALSVDAVSRLVVPQDISH